MDKHFVTNFHAANNHDTDHTTVRLFDIVGLYI